MTILIFLAFMTSKVCAIPTQFDNINDDDDSVLESSGSNGEITGDYNFPDATTATYKSLNPSRQPAEPTITPGNLENILLSTEDLDNTTQTNVDPHQETYQGTDTRKLLIYLVVVACIIACVDAFLIAALYIGRTGSSTRDQVSDVSSNKDSMKTVCVAPLSECQAGTADNTSDDAMHVQSEVHVDTKPAEDALPIQPDINVDMTRAIEIDVVPVETEVEINTKDPSSNDVFTVKIDVEEEAHEPVNHSLHVQTEDHVKSAGEHDISSVPDS